MTRASSSEAQVVNHILNTFEKWSGQVVNYTKSRLFFLKICKRLLKKNHQADASNEEIE